MNIAIINSVQDKSTGKIASGFHAYLKKQGYHSLFCYGYGTQSHESDMYRIDTPMEHYVHALLCRITGLQGGYSTSATKKLIKRLKKNEISLLYGIGLHGYYLNEKLFFDYIIENDISFVYVMTEEYAFLGKCGYSNGCQNYLEGCGNCPQVREYPKSWFFDRTKEMFQIKKNAYERMKRKIFVGPEYTIRASEKSPLMKGVKTQIIDEAIDVEFYQPTSFEWILNEHNISPNKIKVVCVAPLSQKKKGVKYFIELARRFESDSRFVFVHVGYDVRDKSRLPSNYIAIGYEANQKRLAAYYSMADLFVFPSLLDTMPNTCLEALSCGAPLLCFNTSGMPYIADNSVATFVTEKSVDELVHVVKQTQRKTEKLSNICRNYAVKRYDNQLYYEKLLNAGIKLEDISSDSF